jgi:hypothetical protein
MRVSCRVLSADAARERASSRLHECWGKVFNFFSEMSFVFFSSTGMWWRVECGQGEIFLTMSSLVSFCTSVKPLFEITHHGRVGTDLKKRCNPSPSFRGLECDDLICPSLSYVRSRMFVCALTLLHSFFFS